MGEPKLIVGGSVEALYEQMRRVMPATGDEVTVVPTQVASRIRVLALRTPTLPPAAHTNAYLVGPLEGGPVVVIDPGSPYPDQQAALDAALASVEISSIFLTHHHGDHIGGAAALAMRSGAPIAAHVETARLLDGVVSVDRLIADREVIVIGDTRITAIHTPGHAIGHLCFEVDDATVVGDMVAGLGTILIDPNDGDMAVYLASLELLLGRPARTLLPAHGPPIADGHGKLREYLTHRRMREDRVMAAIASRGDDGSTIRELVAIAYADTPQLLWPLAERSLLAHAIKLVRDGRVRMLAVDDAASAPLERQPSTRFASVANPL